MLWPSSGAAPCAKPAARTGGRLFAAAVAITTHFLATAVTGSTPARAQAVPDIVIAAVASPQTPLTPDGRDVATGAQAAVRAINESGGIRGRQLRLAHYDDGCSAAVASRLAETIVQDGAQLVVGHICSSAAIAAAPAYARAGVIMITTGARAPRLTDQRARPFIFRLAGRDDRFGEDTAAMIAATFEDPRVAIVHDKSRDGRALADETVAALARLGITPVHREAYTSGEREYHATAARLVAAGATVLIVPAQPIEAAILFTKWREARPDGVLIGSSRLAIPEIEPLARTAGDRLIVMLPPPRSPAFGTSLEAIRAAQQRAAHAAIEAWAAAARAADSFEPGAVARQLHATTAETVAGRIAFGTRGDALIPSFKAHVFGPHGWAELPARAAPADR